MNQNNLLCIVSLVVYGILLVSIPFRTKKTLSAAGRCEMELKKNTSIRWIFIVLLAPVLILLILFRNLGLLMNVVVCLCALIATEIAVREAAVVHHNGLYESMLISGTFVIPYRSIALLPTVAYENDPETTDVDHHTLRIVTKTGTTQVIIFSSVEERENAVKKLLELEPRLNS